MTDLVIAIETPGIMQSIFTVWPRVPLTTPATICPRLLGIMMRPALIMTGVYTLMTRGAGAMTGDCDKMSRGLINQLVLTSQVSR